MALFMHLVQRFAYPERFLVHKHVGLEIETSTFPLRNGRHSLELRVSGVLTVQALFTGVPPARVLLYLDGRQIDHDTSPPYVFKWNTQRAKDGPHALTLAGRARDGRIVRSRLQVVVANGAYAWDWDASAEAPGAHQLTARAVGADGAVAEQPFTVTVAPPTAG